MEYDMELKKVVEEINKAVERGVEIKIGCGPRFDVENFEIAKMANEGKISLFKLKNRETTHHFRINDKYDTLYHSGKDNRKDMIVWFNNDFSGKIFVERFNKTLENAIKIDKGEFMNVFRVDYPKIDKGESMNVFQVDYSKIDEMEKIDKTDYLKIDETGERHNVVNRGDIAIFSKCLNVSG